MLQLYTYKFVTVALDEFDDINLQVTFDSTTTTYDLPITIINNFIFELKDSATANIFFPGAPVSGVTLSPESASITIDGQLISVIIIVYRVISSVIILLHTCLVLIPVSVGTVPLVQLLSLGLFLPSIL